MSNGTGRSTIKKGRLPPIGSPFVIEVSYCLLYTSIYNKVAEKIIFSHYDTGVLILNGIPITPFININYRTRLKRTPIQRSDGKILFIARIKGWLVLEEVLRKIAGFLRE